MTDVTKPDILSMTLPELKEFVATLGAPGYRAEQIFAWLAKGASPAEMQNLPKAFRETLADSIEWRLPQIGCQIRS